MDVVPKLVTDMKWKNHMTAVLFIVMLFILHPYPVYTEELYHDNGNMENAKIENNVALQIRGRMRVSFQNVIINNLEDMGLYGFHYDVFCVNKLLPGLFFSLGGYSAVTGERGGFFVGGYGMGYNIEILEVFGFEAGLFFGGGGGGNAPQGSGLMLQQYIAFQITLLGVGFQISGSNINFPDGEISGRQIAAGLVIPVESWVSLPNLIGTEPIKNIYENLEFRMLISQGFYFPGGDSKLKDMTKLSDPVGLIGFSMEYLFKPKLFTKFDFHGAFLGEVNGYAQMLVGLGVIPFSIKNTDVVAAVQAGAGGGGAVNTGGGFLVKPALGIRVPLWDNYGVFMDTGYVYAPDGYFGAWSVEAGLFRDILPLRFDAEDDGKLIPAYIELDHWQISIVNKTYFPPKSERLESGIPMEDVIHLIGFSLNHPVSLHLNWTGQAFGAWYGGVGGYAEGLLGLEVMVKPFTSWQKFELTASLLGGAAGGGGMDVGSGIVWESSAGFLYKINDTVSMNIRGGFMDAVNGSLQAILLSLGSSIYFSIPVKS